MEPVTNADTELAAVRARRAELRGTLDYVEITLAAPAYGRAVVWGETVHDALVTLAGDFAAHVEVTEGPGGLHQTILTGDVRLTHGVDQLTAEHQQLAAEIASLVVDSDGPVGKEHVTELRDRATALLAHLIRHRQRGADLVYEAYETDIGGAG
ncbi:hypothetical protein SAMN05443575_4027 [Jatrophihabitans endophyticus]|uniref:Hemerythrin HHE cation binding domain-containing protein n=1 Tax=Jatrophihabitans endophyticus TaxID=1206085 RepID=A0A1M5TSZ8_9ACTN|nr:hypothetical protein [Jatrophihabitans endophyticus]SHH53770.1 hypothetical protein SAMN05443575_4027 [Jatrophihabitans endophyticus]